MSYIIAESLTKTYGQQTVLSNVSLELEKGKIHGVVGRNGSGKTQLFKCICGYVTPDSGKVFVGGKQIGHDETYPTSMGILLEKPGFLPSYSGLFNLQLLAAINSKLKKSELEAVMSLVGLADVGRKRYGKYSLGMQQRLGIAQAIMESPELLILDEPFNGLDNQGVQEIRALLLKLKAKGITIVLASHNPLDIHTLCDTVCEMDAGKLTPVS